MKDNSPQKHVRAEAPFHGDGAGNNPRAKVPATIRNALGAKVGDTLVFEEGCEAAHQRALMRSGSRKYFIVYLEPQPAEVMEAKKKQAVETRAPQLESLEESVRRRRQEAAR